MTHPTWTIKTAPTRLREEWKCALCGATFISDETLADLFDEHEEHQGVVCPACVAAGPEAAQVRLGLRGRGQRSPDAHVRVEVSAAGHRAAPTFSQMPLYHTACGSSFTCVLGAEGAG